jgi:peptide methionine sulfoxide reductase MsrB
MPALDHAPAAPGCGRQAGARPGAAMASEARATRRRRRDAVAAKPSTRSVRSRDSPANLAGTSATPVQKDLRWNCDVQTADRICNFNRHYAEFAGYWEQTSFLKEESEASGEISFYDSNTGNELFTAPRGRSFEQFVKESRVHGWPSFRDDEVNWDYVRVLPDGEAVSVDGTHLGHNLPDKNGNRYCINLVSVAGRPKKA